jgi:cephalosporin hydroxylase
MGNLGETMKKIIFIGLFLFCSFSILNATTEMEIQELKGNICNVLPSIEGWCSKEKALALIELVLEVNPNICVEIGVFGGSSLFPVASTLKFLGKGIVIGIDPWDKFECLRYYDPIRDEVQIKWWSKIDMSEIYRSYLDMLKRYGLENCCMTIKAISEEAAFYIGPIDILYIDGNHSEIVSTKDVRLYLPKVISGGYILMNDTLWEERQEAVELLLEFCDVVKLIDDGNCILFKKR